jgi:hypothetical protein
MHYIRIIEEDLDKLIYEGLKDSIGDNIITCKKFTDYVSNRLGIIKFSPVIFHKKKFVFMNGLVRERPGMYNKEKRLLRNMCFRMNLLKPDSQFRKI